MILLKESTSIYLKWQEQSGFRVTFPIRVVIFKELSFPFDVPNSSTLKLFPTTTLPSDFAPSYDAGSVATREADDSAAVQTAPIVPTQRKSQRTTQLWLQDYVASAHLSLTKPLYSIDWYIGYDHLSMCYQAFL
ncbi:hypothetical protein KY285_023878 [Solanum tuberosum]|nr:hypothetical protein KY289_024213 [Solanum tuberosum]KAH0676077.1 hypothetical protein KY285_023878 [Solanum tuberosum]